MRCFVEDFVDAGFPGDAGEWTTIQGDDGNSTLRVVVMDAEIRLMLTLEDLEPRVWVMSRQEMTSFFDVIRPLLDVH